MANNNFHVWCEDTSNVENSSTFENDGERASGFIPGTGAKSLKVNTALRQANLISCALTDVLIPSGTTNITSDREDVADELSEGLTDFIKDTSIVGRYHKNYNLLSNFSTIATKVKNNEIQLLNISILLSGVYLTPSDLFFTAFIDDIDDVTKIEIGSKNFHKIYGISSSYGSTHLGITGEGKCSGKLVLTSSPSVPWSKATFLDGNYDFEIVYDDTEDSYHLTGNYLMSFACSASTSTGLSRIYYVKGTFNEDNISSINIDYID